jgi:dienelactone hydrolase
MFDLWDLVKRGSLVEPVTLFLGGSPEEVPGRYGELSTIHRIQEHMPPVLLLYGIEDACELYAQSLAFHGKLRAAGVHSEIELYKGKSHGWFNIEPDRTITTERMERFLAEQFGLKENKSGAAHQRSAAGC